MRAALTLALTLALVAGTTQGQAAVPVRSGEHETFSRLVFADALGRAWTVSRPDAATVVIDFSAGAPELVLDSVFDLIPRSRIVAASTEPGRLVLALGCACPVDVAQIPTGHVVIDVRDGPPISRRTAGPLPPGRIRLPLVLPLPEMPFAPPGWSEPSIPSKPLVASTDVAPFPARPAGPPQLRRHPAGSVPIVETAAGSDDQVRMAMSCPLEAAASEAFLADPVAAMAALPAGGAALLDGEDMFVPSAASALARTYLATGWGAEALHVASLNPSADPAIAAVGAALDGLPLPTDAPLDPACGPATALLALLDPAGTTGWNRSDARGFTRFVDSMHPLTRASLAPRLDDRLASLGDGDLLTGVVTSEPVAESVTSPEVVAAGTDERAVRAAIALLEQAIESGGPASEPYLVNAIALRSSLPDGALRQALDESLAKALVLSRRPAEALGMVAEGRATAEDLVLLALDRLPAEAAAEFAVRLRPSLAPGSEASRRAAALFEGFGLDATARAFARPSEATPRAAAQVGLLADPWLARDMPAMVRADPTDWTARTRLAEAVVNRNAAALPETDLAAAGAVLEESRRVGALVADLLVPQDGVTER